MPKKQLETRYDDVCAEMEKLEKEIEVLKEKYLQLTIPFGKHQGKTLEWCLKYDKQYLYWLNQNTVFKVNLHMLGLLTEKELIEREEKRTNEEKAYQAWLDNWNIKKEKEKIEHEKSLQGNYW